MRGWQARRTLPPATSQIKSVLQLRLAFIIIIKVNGLWTQHFEQPTFAKMKGEVYIAISGYEISVVSL